MSDAYRVIITPQAGEDLERIHDYIAKDSPDNAAGMIDRILTSLDSLKQFPYRTKVERSSSDLRHPVRTLVVRPYVIYFRVLDQERVVRILHVIHGARVGGRSGWSEDHHTCTGASSIVEAEAGGRTTQPHSGQLAESSL